VTVTMNAFRPFLLLAIVTLFLSLHANAQTDYRSGNDFLGSCQFAIAFTDNPDSIRTYDDYLRAGFCQGVVMGIGDVGRLTGHICIPESATVSQDERVVLKFLRDHPERLHERDTQLVFEALKQAFPCATH
jgi:hypothetical protein